MTGAVPASQSCPGTVVVTPSPSGGNIWDKNNLTTPLVVFKFTSAAFFFLLFLLFHLKVASKICQIFPPNTGVFCANIFQLKKKPHSISKQTLSKQLIACDCIYLFIQVIRCLIFSSSPYLCAVNLCSCSHPVGSNH